MTELNDTSVAKLKITNCANPLSNTKGEYIPGITQNQIQGPPNNYFFGKCLKKTTEYFLKFLFLFKSTILPVNNGK